MVGRSVPGPMGHALLHIVLDQNVWGHCASGPDVPGAKGHRRLHSWLCPAPWGRVLCGGLATAVVLVHPLPRWQCHVGCAPAVAHQVPLGRVDPDGPGALLQPHQHLRHVPGVGWGWSAEPHCERCVRTRTSVHCALGIWHGARDPGAPRRCWRGEREQGHGQSIDRGDGPGDGGRRQRKRPAVGSSCCAPSCNSARAKAGNPRVLSYTE
mmetsp:Transcript_67990/g.208358  ORF Transcript_67990/g.208358 Transcript_67990/m.208358 type:complete len:210 (-) Transcript_67990:109-738(-)